MSYFNTNFSAGTIGGGVNELALEQFSERAKDAEKQRTDNAMKMAKEQARLESMAVGFGLKPGEAKSMSSVDLDKFVYSQMQAQVKQKEAKAQQMEMSKFLQDKQYQEAQMANFTASQANAQANQEIAKRNSMINQGNMLANRAKMNQELKAGENFRNSIIETATKDPGFADKNKLLVESAKGGASPEVLQKMLNQGMDAYQTQRLGLAKQEGDRSKTTFDQQQQAKTIDFNFTTPGPKGGMIQELNVSGTFASETGAKQFRAEMRDSQKSLTSLQRLINISDDLKKEYPNFIKRGWAQITDESFRTRAKIAKTIVNELMGSSRTEILGGGVLSDQDRALLLDMFVNPGDTIQWADYGQVLREMIGRSRASLAKNLELYPNITATYPNANQANNTQAPGSPPTANPLNPGTAQGPAPGVPQGYIPTTMSNGQVMYMAPGGGVKVTGPDSNSTQ